MAGTALLIGLVTIAALVRQSAASSRIIGVSLGAMWIWTGVVYHGLYFSAINPAALAFGTLFAIQGFGWVHAGLAKRLEPSLGHQWRESIGWFLIVYSIVLYPLIGIAAGHREFEMPMFGIAPCPVTMFTFGVMLLVRAAVPRWLLPVPFAWSLIGGSAAVLLRVPQDWPLLASGIVVIPLLLRQRNAKNVRPTTARSGP